MDNLQNYLKNLETLLGSNATATATASGQAAAETPGQATVQAPEAAATESSAEKQLRFMFVSTHIQQVTGYSKVSYGIIKELAKHPWLKTIHYGFQRLQGLAPGQTPTAHRKYPEGVVEIDAAALDKTPSSPQAGFSFRELPGQITAHKPHVVMLYNDMAVINNFIEAIKASGIPRNFQIWLYVDQVYTQQNAMFLDVINREADRVFTFTKFWRDCLKEQGVHRPIDVLHHGFDAQLFKKIVKEDARKALGLPNEMFLITSFNRNQPRKRLDIMIMAFVELIVKNPSKAIYMLCVSDKGEKGGWLLFELYLRELKKRGVKPEMYGNRLMITSKDMSYKDEEINLMYCAGDVGISTAEGEGWGLCTFEQMGLGIPQVAPDVGGYKEFCTAETAQLVAPKWRYYQTIGHCAVGGEAHVVDPHDVCKALETYLFDSELRRKQGEAGAAKVATYTWESAVKTLVRRLQQQKEDVESDA
jgi:glycosyltransferase involved in cell wall biosynthesis